MPLYLPSNLAGLSRLCAESARYATGSIHVLDLGGAYRAEATDGKRLAVVQGAITDRDLEALEGAPGGAAEALVPAETCRALRIP